MLFADEFFEPEEGVFHEERVKGDVQARSAVPSFKFRDAAIAVCAAASFVFWAGPSSTNAYRHRAPADSPFVAASVVQYRQQAPKPNVLTLAQARGAALMSKLSLIPGGVRTDDEPDMVDPDHGM